MTVQPRTWGELCENAFYDEASSSGDDRPGNSPADPSQSAGPVTTSNLAASFAAGPPASPAGVTAPPGEATAAPVVGLAPTLDVSPDLDGRPLVAQTSQGSADTCAPRPPVVAPNLPVWACLCGRSPDRRNGIPSCHGGRQCMERLLENEERHPAANGGGAQNEPYEEAQVKDKPAVNADASWRTAA